jgi:hypothetical protein
MPRNNRVQKAHRAPFRTADHEIAEIGRGFNYRGWVLGATDSL